MNVGARRAARAAHVDAALAACLVGAAAAEGLVGRHWRAAPVADAVLFTALLAPLAWRRRAPLAVAVVVMAVSVAIALTPAYALDMVTPNAAVLIAPYTVAAYEPRGRALAGLAACALAVTAGNLIGASGLGSWAFALVALGASWATGRVVWDRRMLTARLRRTAARLDAEHPDRARLAVAEARSRIARDVQAVVARSVSAMVVQSQVAQRLLDDDPTAAEAAMTTIERTGRDTLDELRRVLGALHQSDDDRELAPQPGVGQLPTLVGRARADGVDVALRVCGEPRPLPPGVDLAVYRLVEEAIGSAASNAATIHVSLDFAGPMLTVDVAAAGVAATGWPTSGMRERARACRGELAVTTDPGGSMRLRARFETALDGALA